VAMVGNFIAGLGKQVTGRRGQCTIGSQPPRFEDDHVDQQISDPRQRRFRQSR
jgi:hypothetical protein